MFYYVNVACYEAYKMDPIIEAYEIFSVNALSSGVLSEGSLDSNLYTLSEKLLGHITLKLYDVDLFFRVSTEEGNVYIHTPNLIIFTSYLITSTINFLHVEKIINKSGKIGGACSCFVKHHNTHMRMY